MFSYGYALVSVSDGLVVEGSLGRVSTILHLHTIHPSQDTGGFSFPPSLALYLRRCSATTYAAVGMVGRPFSHAVRGVLCEGYEDTAEVREQHRHPPSAFAVREPTVNCRERLSSLSKIMQIVTSAIRAIYLPCVQCRGDTAQGSAASWRPCNVVHPHQEPVSHSQGCKGGRMPKVANYLG